MTIVSDPLSKRQISYLPLQLTEVWKLESVSQFLEFFRLDFTDKPIKAAKLHGVITSLCPLLSGKFFEGRIALCTQSTRSPRDQPTPFLLQAKSDRWLKQETTRP